MRSIEIMALNKDFEVVGILKYTNLQWNRRYYESGSFSLQIPIEQYSSDMAYIYTKGRPELGKISQINYIAKKGTKLFALSGYFLEEELNRRVAYSTSDKTNIQSNPSWESQSGKAEDVATAYFNAFKDVSLTYNGNVLNAFLPITAKESQGRGVQSSHARRDEYLGDKLYTILKPSEMSYRVLYDFIANEISFECWKGVDRTQSNEELNNPIVLSTKYGNITNPDVLISTTNYKQSYIVKNSYTDSSSKEHTSIFGNIERADGETDKDDIFVLCDSSAMYGDFASDTAYINALHADGHKAILDNKKKISVDFDSNVGSYEYLEDFDLGDKCSIEIPEMGLSCDAVLSEIREVIKKGVHTLALTFDTPNTYEGGL